MAALPGPESPTIDLVLTWATWTDLENDCGESRLRGGVYLRASIPAGMETGHRVAEQACEFAQKHLSGQVARRGDGNR